MTVTVSQTPTTNQGTGTTPQATLPSIDARTWRPSTDPSAGLVLEPPRLHPAVEIKARYQIAQESAADQKQPERSFGFETQ